MAQESHHSVSSLQIAAGLAKRWSSDCRAVKAIFRQRLVEIGPGSGQHQRTRAGVPGIKENQTMSMATATRIKPAVPRPRWLPYAVTAGCVILAEWMFYDWPVGISLALFFAVLGIAAVGCNGISAKRSLQMVVTIVFTAGLSVLVEDVNVLSVTWSALAVALFVIILTTPEAASWQRSVFDAALTPLRGPYQLIRDVVGILWNIKSWAPRWLGSLLTWIVPAVLFTVFLALFASANPLIANRLMQIDLRRQLHLLDGWRFGFRLMIAGLVWPLIKRNSRRKTAGGHQLPAPVVATGSVPEALLGGKAIARSLILFNALFGLQTGLDLTYLWGGAALPDGLSYADYAHHGAYPLIATALIAGCFVLIAIRPDGRERSPLIRPLVLLWIGQNILLVISAIFRLKLYVGAYSLTYLRLAALIWMLLVAGSLLLMLIQIFLQKPNSWLIATNAVMLAVALYVCCFINAPRFIASFNIEHSHEISGAGPYLDWQYLRSLGPQTVPVLDGHVCKITYLRSLADSQRSFGLQRTVNWRTWEFRTWRLQRYLANHSDTPTCTSDGSKG